MLRHARNLDRFVSQRTNLSLMIKESLKGKSIGDMLTIRPPHHSRVMALQALGQGSVKRLNQH